MQMKQILLQAFLAGLTLAQLQVIQGALSDVTKGLSMLDTSIKALQDAQSGVALLQQASAVQEAMKKATTTIQGSQELSLQDALGLQQAAQQLPAQAKTTIDDLVAKKPVLDQLMATQQAIQSLKDQKTSADALGKAVVSKVPAVGQQIAQQQIDQIGQVINTGITGLGGSTTKRAVPLRA